MAEPGITSLSDPRSFSEIERFFERTFYKNKYTDRNALFEEKTPIASFSPRVVSRHVENIINELSSTGKGISFILSRQALSALNPTFGMGQIANPLAYIVGPPPGASGYFTNKIDVPTAEANPGTTIARNQQRLRKLYEGNFTQVRTVGGIPFVRVEGPGYRYPGDLNNPQGQTMADKKRELNIATNNENLADLQAFDLDSSSEEENVLRNTKTESPRGVDIQVPDFQQLFSKQGAGPAFGDAQQGAIFFKPTGERERRSATYLRKENALANDDAFFSLLDGEQGYIDTNIETFVDDDFYIPFYFSDFRKPERRIYFKAFLTELTEKFASQWNKVSYYGRIDPVGTYMNTGRNVTIGWKVAAMSKQGLSTMWKKINNFLKMLYPTYVNGSLAAAPLVRVRVGDVIADGQGLGLPGYITDATLNYNETTWEIDTFETGNFETGKVPMVCQMNIGFQIIHERNPSVDSEYNFDTGIFRRMGTLSPPRAENVSGQTSPGGDVDDLIDPFDQSPTAQETNNPSGE